MASRQVYYRLVSRALVENSKGAYRRVGRVLVNMRRSGDVPYGRIVDRTRRKYQLRGWDSAEALLRDAVHQFRRDHWADQPTVVMIALEKQALEGVFAEVVDERGVSLWVVRGYISETFVYDFAEDINAHTAAGQKVVIRYFGDHDPSGHDLERDLRTRLARFGAQFDWARGGIFPEDIPRFNIPPLAAKKSDSRTKKFVERYGLDVTELDALPPAELRSRIRSAIVEHIDPVSWQRIDREEIAQKESLELVRTNWTRALTGAGGSK